MKIQKWGNSQGIRIPKSILDSLKWKENEDVTTVVKNGKLIIEKEENRKKIDKVLDKCSKTLEQIDNSDKQEGDVIMGKEQRQNILDVQSIMSKLNNIESYAIKQLAENMIDIKLLALVPDAILENMDITEKLMLIDLYSKKIKEKSETIPLDDILKEEELD